MRLFERMTRAGVLTAVALALALAATGCRGPEGDQAAAPPAQPVAPATDTPENVRGTVETLGEGADAVKVVHLWGTPREMGYAHGALLKDEVGDFVEKIVGAMMAGMGVTAEVLDEAWAAMEPFVPAPYLEELEGLAEGSGVELQMLKRAHAIPDLSEMDCTFFAAWGEFTEGAKFIQLRALDYATEAHIQDNPAVIIYHPDDGPAYVNVGWCGFVGMVTGMNAEGICMSEIGDDFDKEIHTLQGEPMPFVMRDVVSRATTLDEGVEIVRNASRTSSFLYLIGDAGLPGAKALQTSPEAFEVIEAESTPYGPLGDVVWMSMGADSDWNEKIRTALAAEEGKLTVESAIANVTGACETGDLHTVYFSPTDGELWVANADTDESPGYAEGYVTLDVCEAMARVEP